MVGPVTEESNSTLAVEAPTGFIRGNRGLFAKGTTGGPGRPPGIDFRRLVEEEAERRGVDLVVVLWRVFQSIVRRALRGDMQAAKLLLDKLCLVDPSIAVTVSEMTDSERAVRLTKILVAAKSRVETDELCS